MNNFDFFSNEDGIASTTWPNPCATEDYLYEPYLSVPQSTYPDPIPAQGYPFAGSFADFNVPNDAALSLAPTSEMESFALPVQADFANQVSSQCVGTSICTYPAVPQDFLDSWSMPGTCMFLSCICHYTSYSLDANPKHTLLRMPRSPSRNQLRTRIGQGPIRMPPPRWL